MRHRQTRWYYRLPGAFYASGPTTGYYRTEREVRAMLRDMLRVPRLPNGVEVWRA